MKVLIKNNYYREEISEKIRLFYVALTRAKEKMIMVVPEFKNPLKQNKIVDFNVAFKFRSFYDFISAIAINLTKYIKNISLDSLNLSKDYELNISNNYIFKDEEVREITFYDLKIDSEQIDNKHASKVIKELLTKEDVKALEYGTKMHERLEMTNFKEDNSKLVNNLKKCFDFDKAIIYQELEFYFIKEDTEYHGIIDLMLEYDDVIKIIDYKLKNISDEAYSKQLKVYYDYIKSISDKKILLYLYSIIDEEVKEVDINLVK